MLIIFHNHIHVAYKQLGCVGACRCSDIFETTCKSMDLSCDTCDFGTEKASAF